jgi:hypothetical protein
MQAEKVRQFYEHRELPEEHRPVVEFADREGNRIRTLRRSLWPRQGGEHPNRWTGNRLPLDAEHADRFGDFRFRATYMDRFSPWCWSTHGSGLAGVRLVPPSHFPGLVALPLGECSRFAFIACQLALDYFPELRSDAIVNERFRSLAETGDKVSGDILRNARRAKERS